MVLARGRIEDPAVEDIEFFRTFEAVVLVLATLSLRFRGRELGVVVM